MLSEEKNLHVQYSIHSDGIYIPTKKSINILPTGFYNIERFDNGIIFLKNIHKNTKDLLTFPENYMPEIIEDIDFFWNNKKLFDEFKFPYKRGLLLYGPPGSGKTSVINLLTNKLINDYDGLIIESVKVNDIFLISSILKESFREIEPDRKVIVILEDIESYLINKGTRKELLNLLDGNDSIENVIFLATTNFINEVEEAVLSRPSRFYRTYLIDFPSAANRKFFFEQTLKDKNIKTHNIDKLVSLTEGFTIDYMKELIILVFLYNKDLDESVKLLKNMMINSSKLRNVKTSESFKKTIGFATKVSQDDKCNDYEEDESIEELEYTERRKRFNED